MFKRMKDKNGGVVLSLVIILMLIFPIITSGLMDITNCTIIKRNLKQNLNMASKAAANTIDVTANRNGYYRIKDGVINKYCYDYSDIATTFSTISNNEKYYASENDAAKVFYGTLAYNNLIKYEPLNDSLNTTYITKSISFPTTMESTISLSKEIYPITTFYQDYENKNERIYRDSEYSIVIINNSYDNAKYVALNPAYRKNATTITNNTIGIKKIFEGTSSSNPVTSVGDITIDSTRPTVVAVGVIKYKPSTIFKIFGYDYVYLKEYASSELIANDNYWD